MSGSRLTRRAANLVLLATFAIAGSGVMPSVAHAQRPAARTLPLRQSSLDQSAARDSLTLGDVSQLDRWIGVGARDARWSPDGAWLYFRWPERPTTRDNPDDDPWWRVDRAGRGAEPVADSLVWRIPEGSVSWNRDATLAAWTWRGRVVVWDAARTGGDATRVVSAGALPARHVRMVAGERAVDFMMGEDLFRWDAARGSVRRLTQALHRAADARTEGGRWLATQQLQLFDLVRKQADSVRAAGDRARRLDPDAPQVIPVEPNATIEDVQRSPDGSAFTVRTITPDRTRQPTLYMDFVTASGHAESKASRSKVGEPRDVIRLGIVRADRRIPADSVRVQWLALPESKGRAVNVHGPWWSLEGSLAVIEVITQDDHDLWIARLDVATGATTVVDHQHDDAWLGGPPVQSNYTQPGLVEWLPGGRLAFASERSGWSHLYLAEADGTVRPLTSGEWEVRAATLSRDRSTWLIGASREHPSDDHLYTMPATGGPLARLTTEEGRHDGTLSPDGKRLAVISSRNDRLPDLWLRDPAAAAAPQATRVTVSGSDNYWKHRWLRPEIVTIPHPDGGVVWAGLYRPAQPNPKHPAVVYVHGGGYRQFAHRGWSVYGFSHASHYGMLNWLVQNGYTVLDFDYRGSAGYGRGYRTDIHRSMGVKDVDGAVAAARWLTRTQGVDSSRIGIYGVSYGGFMTLMSLFRYPGTFAAGISAAGVTDWAHYSDDWTSRILGRPSDDSAAYAISSPINHAAGLRDALLIEHGMIDDNVEFQDAARLVQRLLELGKPFDMAFYPTEPHVIEGAATLVDFHKRLAAFFRQHLVDK
ncbi:MAG: S9 family peptidase [Gemmatimonadaceae bacterium]|nr:S9 family peptidase [Gemmatimonadaceae bacterium]